MFTGIVTELGSVVAKEQKEGVMALTLAAPNTAPGLSIGDSVAVNGVCLTAVEIEHDQFSVEVMHETVRRSSLASLGTGGVVNLERPVVAAGRLDGHIVQGHVDGVGVVSHVAPDGDATVMRIELPSELSRYVVEKGSIAIDGVSLTVASVSVLDAKEPWCEVALIPHTLEVTALGRRAVGDTVNLEVDVVAKYVERMMGGAS